MTTINIELPAGVSEESARKAVYLLARHHDLLRRISSTLAAEDTPVAPAVLAQLGRVEALWRSIEDRWGLLTAVEVTQLTGGNPAKARSHTSNLRRRHRLLGVPRHGALRYAGFQFDDAGHIRPEWESVVEMFTDAGWEESDVVLWAASPTGWLDGRVPVDVLDTDPDAVLTAAARVAAGTAA